MKEESVFEKLIENHERNLRRLTMLSNPNIEKLNEEINFFRNQYGKSLENYRTDDLNFNTKLSNAIIQSRESLISFVNERISKLEKIKKELNY